MRWKGRRQSSNIEDRRGGGGGSVMIGRAGGGGIGVIIIGLVLWLVFGINPMALLGEGQMTSPSQQGAPSGGGVQSTTSETDDFVATVLADTEDVWGTVFSEAGADYPEPKLVLFDGQVRSACGFASAASGPFYCPGDQRVYIDLSFFQELRRRFDAPGDFAQAYVIAHEVGHHVQNVVGTLPKVNEMRQRLDERRANALSVRVELQADCYAGIWASRTAQKGLLEEGDIDEALNAASQLGDDMIQKRTQGYVVPEAFNHGSAEDRATWFRRGYDKGKLDACDTFSGSI
ncbi:neutral zinc metallopeptidase [Afifella sp. IM 167]|uniref:KPN_02809 family neutral zinc metallopeptidase n=1 Tax=Afifella sp. IM 167 TaxID=2033586 RepID=UPI001CCC688F|nr:neutral zinc metallopeptidase [Afifella sp. IM 167]MBZ8132174.1 flagellar biosynthesis protein FlgM [Afifella sp. IM 167]